MTLCTTNINLTIIIITEAKKYIQKNKKIMLEYFVEICLTIFVDK